MRATSLKLFSIRKNWVVSMSSSNFDPYTPGALSVIRVFAGVLIGNDVRVHNSSLTMASYILLTISGTSLNRNTRLFEVISSKLDTVLKVDFDIQLKKFSNRSFFFSFLSDVLLITDSTATPMSM